jgi:restriction system protein
MKISPKEYEQYVKDWFDGLGYKLIKYESKLNDKLGADDGTYEIDISINYEALGVNMHVLVECKKYTSNIKRDIVQILHQKLQSLGAHKGIICTTSDFQKGALEYAKKHGIACIQVLEGQMTVMIKSASSKEVSQDYCDYFGIPKFAGYIIELSGNSTRHTAVSRMCLEYIEKILKP